MKNKQDIKIIEYLRRVKHATVEEMAMEVGCSQSTIRRRLSLLSDMGVILRTHGGATVNDSENVLPNFSFRNDRNKEVKKRIALSAYKLIKDGDVVFLDDSSTAYTIIPYLTELDNILVVTNGVEALALLSKYNIPTISTGGKTDPKVSSALSGEFAENTLKNIFCDVCFITASCVNADGIISDVSYDVLPVKRVAIKNSKQKVFLFDSEKFGKNSTYKWFDLTDFDTLVTDFDLSNFVDSDKLPKNIIKI